MAIHFVKKEALWPLFFIAFLKGSKHNYQLDQALENFKYSFYFDGTTLSEKHLPPVYDSVKSKKPYVILAHPRIG